MCGRRSVARLQGQMGPDEGPGLARTGRALCLLCGNEKSSDCTGPRDLVVILLLLFSSSQAFTHTVKHTFLLSPAVPNCVCVCVGEEDEEEGSSG